MKLVVKLLLISVAVTPLFLHLSSKYIQINNFGRQFNIPFPKENYADIIISTVYPKENNEINQTTYQQIHRNSTLGIKSSHSPTYSHLDVKDISTVNTNTAISKTTNTIKQRKLIWDINSLPSPTHSHFEVKDTSTLLKLGDIIHVNILLCDSLNRTITRGGDAILIWMQGGADGAVAGNVKDHGNGSYTGAVRAMWTGSSVIKGAISCSSEGFDFMYYYLRKFGQARRVYCIFENNNVTENTFGSPTVPLKGQYCNLTHKNYDNPWYCGMPKQPAIQCEDWTGILQGRNQHSDEWLFTTNQTLKNYLKRAIGHAAFKDIGITINPGPAKSLVPNEQCKRIPSKESWSWSTENPTGFFYAGAWHLTRCSFPRTDINQCFKDKIVRMFGDSTVRQWYEYLNSTLDLKPAKNEKHSLFKATQTKYNYTIILSPHGTPIYYGYSDLHQYRPIYDQLNDILPGSRDIVLIHLYAHFNYHHPDLITERLKRTAESITRLLKRAPDVKVAIKAPHYFRLRGTTLGGMWGPLYEQIIRDVFKNLYDRVFFLDCWSMTLARENGDIHPNGFVVANMVKMFVGHVCN